MNRIAKGKRIEREVAKFFENLGYLTYRPTWSRWSKKDIFQKFDIIAVKKKEEGVFYIPGIPKVIFIQVKSNISDFYKARKEIGKWLESVELPSKDVGVMVVLRKSKNIYRIFSFQPTYLPHLDVEIDIKNQNDKVIG